MDEYISREAVVRYLKGYSEKECNSNSPYGMITSSVLSKAERAISEMPAADVQPVNHARWEQIGKQSAKCTACGGVLKSNGIDKTGKALIHNAVYHYCPYCGAKMDLKEESK